MAVNSAYVASENDDYELNELKNINNVGTDEAGKVYSYSEAIEIAGNGCYNYGLLATLSLPLLAMSIDIFSFSTIVSLSSCEFQLSLTQTRVLLAMPYAGAIVMSFCWGYISDTQGRLKSMLIAMSGSFVISVLCAFSPNWIMLAILKFVGTCFSCCANSATFALLGESCSDKWKDSYMIAMALVMNMSVAIYFAFGYLITQFNFSLDLGFVSFLPWRVLTLVLSLPLGLSVPALLFYYESPKYLLNAGYEKEALGILTKIYERNGGVQDMFPVKTLKLTEFGNEQNNNIRVSLFKSVQKQTLPLFKPPLLKHTILLYSMIFIYYSTVSGVLVWLPYLAGAFTESVSSGVKYKVFCELIPQSTNTATGVGCEKIELPIVIFCIVAVTALTICHVLIAKLSSRRRTVLISLHLISAASSLCTLYARNSILNLFAFIGIWLNSLCISILLSYCVDLYPTSYRGMATSCSVIVSRMGSLIGVDVIGPYFLTHCSSVFYISTGFILCNALLSLLLPSDKAKDS